jgi:hypothetical protein
MTEEKCPVATISMLIKAAVPIIARSLATWRPSTAWLTTAFIAVATAVICTTVRVPNSYLDVAGLHLLVLAALLAATTCFLIALRVRSPRTYPLAWFSVIVAFVCCVVLT